MTARRYSSSSDIKLHNRSAILISLLYESHATRASLSDRLGLSTATITNLIGELLEEGIVMEDGTVSNRNKKNVGRPQTSLRLVPASRTVFAIYIEVGSIRIAVTDICARIVGHRTVTHALDAPAEQVLRRVAAAAQEVVEHCGINPHDIVGAGIGASGLVDAQSGENIVAHNLGWSNLQLKDYFLDALNMPVSVDNNVRAMALGESMFGVGRNVDIQAFIYGRVGLGAGFVIGDQLYRGVSGGAGEMGHSTVFAEGGEKCSCGNTGCLQTLVSETAILKAAQRIGNFASISEVYDAARAGDILVQALITERGTYLGLAVANLVNILNPSMIVFGGMFAEASDLWLPVIADIVNERTFAGLGKQVALKTTAFGEDAGIVGAASLALNAFFYRQMNPAHAVI